MITRWVILKLGFAVEMHCYLDYLIQLSADNVYAWLHVAQTSLMQSMQALYQFKDHAHVPLLPSVPIRCSG